MCKQIVNQPETFDPTEAYHFLLVSAIRREEMLH